MSDKKKKNVLYYYIPSSLDFEQHDTYKLQKIPKI